MATLRAISGRLRSVKNIQKITKSMKMVSAAKYGKAERELKAARPIGEKVQQFLERTNLSAEPPEKEIDPEKKKKHLLYVAVTSDRGLCGAVHSNIARQIRKSVIDSNDELKIVCIGEKAKAILQAKFRNQILFVCNEIGRLPPTFLDACKIANEILRSDYEFELGKIFYNKFNSAVSYSTKEIYIYPVKKALDSEKINNYEEADEETITSFIEFATASLLYSALKEGATSEQAARMTAMDSASKNAGEMIQGLTLTFNRTRQAVITRELIEIISGASAL